MRAGRSAAQKRITSRNLASETCELFEYLFFIADQGLITHQHPVNYIRPFSDIDEYYLQVGDGNICTVALLTNNTINDILSSTSGKIPECIKTCKEKSLEASKHIGVFDNIDIYFNSIDGGRLQFVKMTVRGKRTRVSLIEIQDVFFDELNYMCLVNKMANRSILLQKKRNADDNARLLN